MFVGLHANLRSKCLCGNYILHLGKHEVYPFAQICIFSFKATPFSQKYKFIILLVYLFFMGCCTSYYNIPTSLPEGGLVLAHLRFVAERTAKTQPSPLEKVEVRAFSRFVGVAVGCTVRFRAIRESPLQCIPPPRSVAVAR